MLTLKGCLKLHAYNMLQNVTHNIELEVLFCTILNSVLTYNQAEI